MTRRFKPELALEGVSVPWRRALRATVSLWLFVLLIFAPLILRRHPEGAWGSILLDASTVVVSIALGMALFALFRATTAWRRSARVAVMVAAIVLVSVAQAAFDIAFTGWVAQNFYASWVGIPRTLGRAYGALFNYLLVFTVNVALFQLALSRRRVWRQAQRLAEFKSSAQKAEIAALRFQIDPHFLFNSLNAISSMIIARRNEEAEQLTDRLSAFIRRSSDIDPMVPITLDQELCGTEDYLEIEQVRFGDRLSCEIDCSREAGARPVPARILQPLVARFIDQAVPCAGQCLDLAIGARVEADTLLVDVTGRTNCDPLERCADLDLVEARLAALYGERGKLSVLRDDDRVTARIAIEGVAA